MSANEGRSRGGRGGGGRGRGDGAGGSNRGGFRGGFRGDRGGDHRGSRGGYRGDRGGDRGRGGGADVQIFRQSGIDISADERVTRAEDASLEKSGGIMTLGQMTLQEKSHPRRPGYGTKGTPVLLLTNYVQIVPRMDLDLYKYDIACTPEAKGKKLGWIIQLALRSPELSVYQDHVVTDFRSTVISRSKFDSDDFSLTLRYHAENEDVTEDAATYSIRVQYTNTLPVSQLMQYLTSASQTPISNSPEILQAFNIFFNHYAKLKDNQVRVGSSKTFSLDNNSATRTLGSGLIAIRGFFSSVRLATCRMLVNVNVSNAAFYQPGPLTDLISAFSRYNSSKFSLAKFIEKVAIRATHLPPRINSAGQEVHRPKRIFGLATPADGQGQQHRPKVPSFGASANEVQFYLEDRPTGTNVSKQQSKSKGKKGKLEPSSSSSSTGRYITVAEYFRERYKPLKRPQDPVINTGSLQNPAYLPPEVCIVLPGQNSKSKLDPEQTQEMIRFAVRRPWQNASSIVDEGLQTVGLDPRTNKLMEHFGITVQGHLITVKGRVLDSPKIQYQGNKSINAAFGSWNLREVGFKRAGTIKEWSCVNINMANSRSQIDAEYVKNLMFTLHKNLKDVGIHLPVPKPANELYINNPEDPKLDSLMQRAAANFTVLYVILPAKNAALYNRIKLLGDVKYGIHTICGIAPTIIKQQGNRLDQYFANVALKFNLKLGGQNHSLDATRNMPLLAESKTMLMGIDVTHPSPGSTSPSIVAVVASIDKSIGQFPAILRHQTSRQENVSDLSDLFLSRLELWRKYNRSLPDNIVIYRDGVSEGQYDSAVLSLELPQLRAAAAKIYPPKPEGFPRITLIVVGKRHHTRFYPTSESTADRSGNTKPGTVVDRGITQAENWDFFLQPHAALQGTARPGHYYVLVDEVFREHYKKMKPDGRYKNVADVVEEFTHSLCYMFGRATKAVSLCPPAYYADIACERGRCYIANKVDTPQGSRVAGSGGSHDVRDEDLRIHERLRDSMFYI